MPGLAQILEAALRSPPAYVLHDAALDISEPVAVDVLRDLHRHIAVMRAALLSLKCAHDASFTAWITLFRAASTAAINSSAVSVGSPAISILSKSRSAAVSSDG